MTHRPKPFHVNASSGLLHAAGLRTTRLPIEIWDEQGRRLLWSGIAGERVRNLKRNKNYLVTAVVPRLGLLSELLKLQDDSTEFTLGGDPSRWLSERRPAVVMDAPASDVVAPPSVSHIEFYSANLLADSTEVRTLEQLCIEQPASGSVTKVEVPRAGNQTCYLRLRQNGRPTLNLAIPQGTDEPSTVSIRWSGIDPPGIEVQFHNAEVNLLLEYASEVRPRQIDALVRGSSLLGQAGGEISSAMGAIIGGYVALRLHAGALNHAEQGALLEALFERWPGIPDTAVLWAEHNARSGEHETAAQVLLTLLDHGLPNFSSGIGYALKRLDRYAVVPLTSPLAQGPEQMRKLRTRLGVFAAATDPARLIAAFHGDNPVLWAEFLPIVS